MAGKQAGTLTVVSSGTPVPADPSTFPKLSRIKFIREVQLRALAGAQAAQTKPQVEYGRPVEDSVTAPTLEDTEPASDWFANAIAAMGERSASGGAAPIVQLPPAPRASGGGIDMRTILVYGALAFAAWWLYKRFVR